MRAFERQPANTDLLAILVQHSGGLEVGMGSKAIEARPGTAIPVTPSPGESPGMMRAQSSIHFAHAYPNSVTKLRGSGGG
jgi:hypothetical protein